MTTAGAGARALNALMIPETDLQVGAKLADGGQGEVFRGRWRNRDVAVKRLHADISGVARGQLGAVLNRGMKELERMAAAATSSTRVCPLLGFTVKDAQLHIVMPLYERGSLVRRIAERGAGLRPEEVVEVAVQLLEGLQDLHHRDIVHRDIKPANVLVDDQGNLLLADFGLATVVEGSMGVSWTSLDGTRIGAVGTAQYMAPEQWDTELGRPTPASDAYAAAATLCHVASGQPPYGNKQMQQIMTDVLVRKRLPTVPDSVPEPLRSALRGALQFHAADRTSVAEMLKAARKSSLAKCCVCKKDADVQLTVTCSQGAHRVCGECLAVKVGTLADSRVAFTAEGHLQCRKCTGQACEGELFAHEVVAKTQHDPEAGRRFLKASQQHAAEAAKAVSAREVEELQKRLLEVTKRSGSEAEAVDAHRSLVEELNVKRCPWCLADCREDAHRHVASCTRNPRRLSVSETEAKFRQHEAEEERMRVRYVRGNVPWGQRAVWEKANGLPAIREARMQWTDVEAETGMGWQGGASGNKGGRDRDPGPAVVQPTPGQNAAETSGKLLRTLAGHSDMVHSIAVSPDGRWVASGSEDNTIKVWNAATGKLVRTLSGLSQGVGSVAFSVDGRWLASGSWDGAVKLWDTATGKLMRTLYGHSEGVASVAFSPSGVWVASGSADSTVKLWSTAPGEIARTLAGHSDTVASVALSPDSRWLASGSWDSTVKLWDAATGELVRTLSGHLQWVRSVAFSPDGRWLASGAYDRTVKLWNAATGAVVRTMEGHSDWVYSVAFSPDGRWVASGSLDETVKMWNTATGELVHTLYGHSGSVWSVAFSPDGRWVASGSVDTTVKLWNVGTLR